MLRLYKLTRQWVVTLEGKEPRSGEAMDIGMNFSDVVDIFGGVPILKRSFLEKIVEMIGRGENYYAWNNIKDVKPPEEVDVNLDQYFIILAADKGNRKYGFLMILIKAGVALCGIWPEALANAVRKNKEILDRILFSIAERPDTWEEVILVCSKNIGKEKDNS